jgi:hypothetical protein
MIMAQRIAACLFAAFLWLVAFGAMTSVDGDQQWLAFVSLLSGMILALWAIRPTASPEG